MTDKKRFLLAVLAGFCLGSGTAVAVMLEAIHKTDTYTQTIVKGVSEAIAREVIATVIGELATPAVAAGKARMEDAIDSKLRDLPAGSLPIDPRVTSWKKLKRPGG